ncbi:SDR family oxidoreductase [Marinobacter sp. 71-i]|uniref:SDR family oxidoreductase n=1 Tax=Marinobacter iranensis TaxID=2962607 RepID=A0ABT5Y7M1_9GAMM|nr:SDR family oxidoreductase [Marinobacter iranensis]MDF0749576.1 SDR family oxidoreductase [Marinobacter iranensis]
MRLEGKTCLITGAAGGIGLAMSRAFIAEGAHVVMTDLASSQLEQQAQELLAADATGATDRLLALVMDVTDPASIKSVYNALVEKKWPVNVLVNNAAVITVGNLLNTSNEDLNRVFKVNVEGLLNVTRAFLPAMISAGSGNVLNMASLAAVRAMHDRFAYGASKASIQMMTRSIAVDFVSQGIRANCILPARVHTDFIEGYIEQYYPGEEESRMEEYSRYQPIGRMIKPEEVAHAAVYLCSDESAMVTGTSMLIDGGVMAGDN